MRCHHGLPNFFLEDSGKTEMSLYNSTIFHLCLKAVELTEQAAPALNLPEFVNDMGYLLVNQHRSSRCHRGVRDRDDRLARGLDR